MLKSLCWETRVPKLAKFRPQVRKLILTAISSLNMHLLICRTSKQSKLSRFWRCAGVEGHTFDQYITYGVVWPYYMHRGGRQNIKATQPDIVPATQSSSAWALLRPTAIALGDEVVVSDIRKATERIKKRRITASSARISPCMQMAVAMSTGRLQWNWHMKTFLQKC